jgi:hypothetical protein
MLRAGRESKSSGYGDLIEGNENSGGTFGYRRNYWVLGY